MLGIEYACRSRAEQANCSEANDNERVMTNDDGEIGWPLVGWLSRTNAEHWRKYGCIVDPEKQPCEHDTKSEQAKFFRPERPGENQPDEKIGTVYNSLIKQRQRYLYEA